MASFVQLKLFSENSYSMAIRDMRVDSLVYDNGTLVKTHIQRTENGHVYAHNHAVLCILRDSKRVWLNNDESVMVDIHAHDGHGHIRDDDHGHIRKYNRSHAHDSEFFCNKRGYIVSCKKEVSNTGCDM